MTVVVTHTTPADGTFSATGAAAWDAAHALSGVGTMAEQDANNVAITGGAINNTTIGATTPSTGVFTTLTATGQTSLGGVAGAESVRAVVPSTTGGNYWQFAGSASNMRVDYVGTSTNIGSYFVAKGTGFHSFTTAGSITIEQMRVAHTASAVNYVQVTGSATGNNTTISAQGSDSAIGVNFQSKGTSGFNFFSGGGSNRQLRIDGTITSVNYLDVWGGASGSSPSLRVAGTDTNISQVFQSKGTGAIDLAAGSSGVNISNGGTVTAITRTASGGSYTSMPSMAISAPTTAGGVQATATPYMGVQAGPTLGSGGTGYTANDVLTISGYVGTPSTIRVDTVSAGVITGFTLTAGGAMSTIPSATSPVSFTGGTGSGATFNILYQMSSSGALITNAGSGYVEQPTVTFSGGGGSGAAAYATVGSATTVRSLGSTVQFATPAGIQAQISDSGSATPTAYPNLNGSTFNLAYVTAVGSAGNAGLVLASKGTSPVDIYTNSTGSRAASFSHTASAVNYVQVTGAATGGRPTISAQGSDTNINFNITAKGSASVYSQNGLGTAFEGYAYGNANYLSFNGTGAGVDPFITVKGSDTNIDLVLQPKGTGALQAQQTDSTATGGNARGANAVDWSTARFGASAVASGVYSVVSGGWSNSAIGGIATVAGGQSNAASGYQSNIGGGVSNTTGQNLAVVGGGQSNSSSGFFNFIGGGSTNSGTATAAVTTQSATMNGTTAVTLSGSNASIKVGQLIVGTSIATFTYVAAISGTSLTLSQAASGSSTSTLSFYTPHGVVVGGGNNQATGAYSFIGGGGDAGTAGNRNVASGDWSFVGGGSKNVASGKNSVVVGGGDGTATYSNQATGSQSFVGGGLQNTATANATAVTGGALNAATSQYGYVGGGYSNGANGQFSTVAGGAFGNSRGITGNTIFPACFIPIASVSGSSQAAVLIIARQTTDATATVLTSDSSAASTTNQVILPNNSAYYFKVEIIANVTGGGNTSGWELKGVIKRGANAASTAIVGSVTSTLIAQDAGASTWAVSATADTTNGGLKITCTGQASTTIRWVAKASTTEVTF